MVRVRHHATTTTKERVDVAQFLGETKKNRARWEGGKEREISH
jgi:hypothetical protein